MWSCPNELEPYAEAYKLQEKKKDENNWLLGVYVKSAFETVMAHFGAGLSGKKTCNAKYIEKPIMQQVEEQSKPMSEKELQKQRELFVAKLEAMKTNFELNHKTKDGTGS